MRYNLEVSIYPVEYVEKYDGYEPVEKEKPLIRYNFILSKGLKKKEILKAVKKFVAEMNP